MTTHPHDIIDELDRRICLAENDDQRIAAKDWAKQELDREIKRRVSEAIEDIRDDYCR